MFYTEKLTTVMQIIAITRSATHYEVGFDWIKRQKRLENLDLRVKKLPWKNLLKILNAFYLKLYKMLRFCSFITLKKMLQQQMTKDVSAILHTARLYKCCLDRPKQFSETLQPFFKTEKALMQTHRILLLHERRSPKEMLKLQKKQNPFLVSSLFPSYVLKEIERTFREFAKESEKIVILKNLPWAHVYSNHIKETVMKLIFTFLKDKIPEHELERFTNQWRKKL